MIQKFRLGVQVRGQYSSISALGLFSAELLPSQSVPSLEGFSGLVQPTFWVLHLPFLDFMGFLVFLPPACCVAPECLPCLHTPPSLVSPAGLSILLMSCGCESPAPLPAWVRLFPISYTNMLLQTLRNDEN